MWSDSIWSIADASKSKTKFIISDHPVTVYNPNCNPDLKYCYGDNDPDDRFSGTHTIYPLSSEKVLILTNLHRVRNFYSSPLRLTPNPNRYRLTFFDFTKIQVGRKLSDYEVNELNYIIKLRAKRYIAAGQKDWLYPEKVLQSSNWKKLGDGYLCMPDPRQVQFHEEVLIKLKSGKVISFDGYNRRFGDPDYMTQRQKAKENASFEAFESEFARIFGPKFRGSSNRFMQLKTEDSPEHHKYILEMETKRKIRLAKLKKGNKVKRFEV